MVKIINNSEKILEIRAKRSSLEAETMFKIDSVISSNFSRYFMHFIEFL